MEKNAYIDKILDVVSITQLPSSNLIRKDKSLFTFSPIQDELEHFKKESGGLFYKEQDCFRQVYPANLVNPLATPFQSLISIFSFEKVDYLSLIKRIIDSFGDLVNPEKIYLIIPEISGLLQRFKLLTENVISIEPERLRCKLPLPGEHFYVKVCIQYYDGLVTFLNFVLVDFKDSKKPAKLDSVFFPQRLDMIREGAGSIYEVKEYEDLYFSLHRTTGNHEFTHFLISQLLAIDKLFSEIKEFSHHKHGYVLKKLTRQLFLECDYHDLRIQSLVSFFPNLSQTLPSMYEEYSHRIKKAIERIEKSGGKIDANFAYETLGLPHKLYQLWVDPTYKIENLPHNFAYYRDASKNQHRNPLESYR